MVNTHIQIKNIYYMLSYAFEVLKKGEYERYATESFDNACDLLAEILYIGVSSQLKKGLGRDYITRGDDLSVVRGKIDIAKSIKNINAHRLALYCRYDVFSVNSYLNRVLKTTIYYLTKSNVKPKIKAKLKSLLFYFNEVDLLVVSSIKWNFTFDRNNQTYQMLIYICKLILNGLLQNTNNGKFKLLSFFDEKELCYLYEKFLLNFYKKHYGNDLLVSHDKIKWAKDSAVDDKVDDLLPSMQPDIVLSVPKTQNSEKKILIIDAKFYKSSTQKNYGKDKLISNNLYQIFTYVKNLSYAKENEGAKVSGMLLYAKTQDEQAPDASFTIRGNTFSVKTLDLNRDFKDIKQNLDEIAKSFIK